MRVKQSCETLTARLESPPLLISTPELRTLSGMKQCQRFLDCGHVNDALQLLPPATRDTNVVQRRASFLIIERVGQRDGKPWHTTTKTSEASRVLNTDADKIFWQN